MLWAKYCITKVNKVFYYKTKQRCITKLLYYKCKQRRYDQSIVLQK